MISVSKEWKAHHPNLQKNMKNAYLCFYATKYSKYLLPFTELKVMTH